jgi:hypothetical protein
VGLEIGMGAAMKSVSGFAGARGLWTGAIWSGPRGSGAGASGGLTAVKSTRGPRAAVGAGVGTGSCARTAAQQPIKIAAAAIRGRTETQKVSRK